MKHKILFMILFMLTQTSVAQSDFLQCSELLRKQRWGEVEQMKESPLVSCQSLVSLPVMARKIMDKTQDIYSAFVVTERLADCLSIDPLRLLPKFSNESGLVSQIQNRTGKDTGLGQLTGPAIRDVQQKWKKIKSEVDSSEKSSCTYVRELIAKTGETKFFGFPDHQRCQLMFSEEGASRNIVFSLFFHRINRDYIGYYFETENIMPLVIRAGGSAKMEDSLKELLVMLSYNSGAKTAVINLKSFLESRIDFSARKAKEFESSRLLTREQNASLRLITDRDFDFAKGNEDFRALVKDLPRDAEGSLNPQDLRNISSSLMTFPVWLRVWQSAGAPGYLSHLSDESNRMSKLFGEQCVDSEFYSPTAN